MEKPILQQFKEASDAIMTLLADQSEEQRAHGTVGICMIQYVEEDTGITKEARTMYHKIVDKYYAMLKYMNQIAEGEDPEFTKMTDDFKNECYHFDAFVHRHKINYETGFKITTDGVTKRYRLDPDTLAPIEMDDKDMIIKDCRTHKT